MIQRGTHLSLFAFLVTAVALVASDFAFAPFRTTLGKSHFACCHLLLDDQDSY